MTTKRKEGECRTIDCPKGNPTDVWQSPMISALSYQIKEISE